PRETMLVGLGDHYTVPDADEDWYLPLSDEEDTANVVPAVAWAQPDRTDEQMLQQPDVLAAIPVLAGAASTPPFASPVPALLVSDGNEARRRESDPDKRPRKWLGWAGKGLLVCTLLLGSAGLQLFWANSIVPDVRRQESREA